MLILPLLGVIWGLLGLMLDLLWASWDAPGALLRAHAGSLELERFVSFSSVFLGAFWLDPGEGCDNMQRAFAGCLELERFVSFSCLFPELSGSIPGKAENTCETQHQPVALLGR